MRARIGTRARARSTAAAVAAGLLAGLVVPSAARAGVVTVDCTSATDDIAAVQQAVDTAPAGGVIRLQGTCDFSRAPAHGGDRTSIAATAVLVRPGTPVTGLTIESAGAPRSATVVGSGTQTAFAVAPGNTGVTIRGLRLVNFARPIVVLGAAGATIGDAGGLPSPSANEILGGVTMNSAVLAVATDAPMSVRYGSGTEAGTATITGAASLTGFSALGNSIVYSPPGPPDPNGASDIVGIDVRQAGASTVDGVRISQNAVAMFTSDFGSYRENAVRVEALAPAVASNPAQRTDYRIRHVTVEANNFGRFDQLPAGSVQGVNPSDTHAAGRAGVVLEGVGDFSVSSNSVRARISTTGSLNDPGGGIVASDSGFGTVAANSSVVVVADATTPDTTDLGAVGVVSGVPQLLGAPGPRPASTAVTVTGNLIGAGPDSVGARRGIVLSGNDSTTAWSNTVAASSRASVFIGAPVTGPTGATLPLTVTRAVVCANTLHGTLDDPTQVSFNPGSPPSTGDAFPGGAATGAANLDCPPTVTLTPPGPLRSTDSLAVAGRSWASRPATVTVRDQAGVTLTHAITADPSGAYATTFTTTELSGLVDGILTVVTTASDPAGTSLASPPVTIVKDFVVDPPPAGSVAINDPDGDGYANAAEVTAQVVAGTWTASGTRASSAIAWWSDAAGNVPAGCGPYAVGASGAVALPYACGAALPQGTVRFNVQWKGGDGEVSPVVSASIVKDTVAAPPTITSPAGGSTVTTSSTVTVTGTSEAGSAVTVSRKAADGTWQVAGTAAADSAGNWNASLGLPQGSNTLSAVERDRAGNTSAPSPAVTFTVQAPSPPPPPPPPPPNPPVITAPSNGSLHAGSFVVSGTSDPSVAIAVLEGQSIVGQGAADASGRWAVSVRIGTSGTHALHALAGNAAGQVSAASNTLTVQVDADPPTATITTPDRSVFTVANPVVISGTAVDAQTGVNRVYVLYYPYGSSTPVQVRLATCTGCPAAGGQVVTWQSSPSPDLPPGAYTATVVPVDAVDNVSGTSITFVKAP